MHLFGLTAEQLPIETGDNKLFIWNDYIFGIQPI